MTVYYFTCLNLTVYIIVQFVYCVSEDQCFGCNLFRLRQKDQPQKKRAIVQTCPKSCPNCPLAMLRCNDGVSEVMDGCKCCYMCARQHGDMCSKRDICDRGLFCDIPDGELYGICRANNAKPCKVRSAVYSDGQQFKLDCKQLCTCQNGRYGCVNLCPQEQRPPDKEHCPNAKLTDVRGQCCKEWTCVESFDELQSVNRQHVHSANLVLNNNQHFPNDAVVPKQYRRENSDTDCSKKNTKWSPCSVTCGVGVSVRISPKNCKKQQTRLCYLRPCGEDLIKEGKCSPTVRSVKRRKIEFKGCVSVRSYRMKFCTRCRTNRCCYPRKQKTRSIEFLCDGERHEYLKYAWIKKCRCSKNCYKKRTNKIE